MKELFRRDIVLRGQDDYPEYRIPGVVVTERGALLLVCEARTQLRDDWNRIDIKLWRSVDGGESWSERLFTPDAFGGAPTDTLNNPTLIVDGERIHLIVHVNYARAFIAHSVDDGVSWSDFTEITEAFREFPYTWNCCATGPGHGLRLSSGRLIAPIWLANGAFEDPEGVRRAHEPSVAGSIYSDDRGVTWHAGPMTDGLPDANETAVAELPDGRVLYNMRTRYKGLRRTLAVSKDGVAPLEDVHICEALNDPMCFGSMANLADGRIAFVNCDVGAPDTSHPDRFEGEEGRTARINLTRAEYGARENLTVRATEDGGRTWESLALVDRIGGYADIAARGNRIYVFYEYAPWENRIVEKLTLAAYAL